MNSYIMRVDVSEDKVIEEFLEWVRKYAAEQTLVVVEENPKGDNRHLHAMFQSDSAIRTIRENFKYNFKKYAKDSRYYSINEKEGQLIYLCKGPLAISKIKDPKYPGEKKYPIVHHSGWYSEDVITKAHEDWWSQAKSMRIGKAEREEKLSELDSMLSFVMKKNKGVDGKIKPDYSEMMLMEDLVDYYVSNKKMIRYSMLSEYVDTIWLILLNTFKRDREYIESRKQVIQNLLNYRIKKY